MCIEEPPPSSGPSDIYLLVVFGYSPEGWTHSRHAIHAQPTPEGYGKSSSEHCVTTALVTTLPVRVVVVLHGSISRFRHPVRPHRYPGFPVPEVCFKLQARSTRPDWVFRDSVLYAPREVKI